MDSRQLLRVCKGCEVLILIVINLKSFYVRVIHSRCFFATFCEPSC